MDTDFNPGDPAKVLLGKDDEQPARVHAPQKPKPSKTARTILADIRLRKQQLEFAVREYPRLIEADKRLKKIK